jgi:hypothetical protein
MYLLNGITQMLILSFSAKLSISSESTCFLLSTIISNSFCEGGLMYAEYTKVGSSAYVKIKNSSDCRASSPKATSAIFTGRLFVLAGTCSSRHASICCVISGMLSGQCFVKMDSTICNILSFDMLFMHLVYRLVRYFCRSVLRTGEDIGTKLGVRRPHVIKLYFLQMFVYLLQEYSLINGCGWRVKAKIEGIIVTRICIYVGYRHVFCVTMK